MKFRPSILIAVLLAAALFGSNIQASDYRQGPRSVTLWWLFFNNPDACVANPGGTEQCGAVDVFGEAYLESVATGSPDPSLISPNLDSKLAVIYATGGKTSTGGRVRLVASAYRSAADVPLSLGPGAVDPLGLGRALENPNAEVHLVVRDHGPRIRGALITQITNFLEPFCSDPNLLFFSGPNTCQDVQFAIFGANESGIDSVYAFSDPEKPVRRARAHLVRNGDMVQAIVETRIKNH